LEVRSRKPKLGFFRSSNTFQKEAAIIPNPNYPKRGNPIIKGGDMFKNVESGEVFTVKSVNPSIIILATKDESHSMLVNPNSIESVFLPSVEDEVKRKLK
jgi:hypothetical protein